MRFALAIALLVVACSPPKGAVVEPLAPWRTEEGAKELRYEMLESFIEQEATTPALTLIKQLRDEGETAPILDLYQALALQLEGFYGEAERILVEYRKKEPRDTRGLKALALLYADTERTDEAIGTLQRVVEIDDKDPEAWNNLGFLLLSAGRPEEAQTALEQAVGLDGTIPKYRNNLGFALAANGHWRQAFEAFQSAGRTGEAHYNLAVAYELADDGDQALRHYKKTIEYDPNHAASKEAIQRLEPNGPSEQEE